MSVLGEDGMGWDGETVVQEHLRGKPSHCKEGSGESGGCSLCQDGSGTRVSPGLVMGALSLKLFPGSSWPCPTPLSEERVQGRALCLCILGQAVSPARCGVPVPPHRAPSGDWQWL